MASCRILTVSLPEEVVLWLDAVKSLSGENRSAIIGFALKEFMEHHPGIITQVVAMRKESHGHRRFFSEAGK